MNLRWNWFNKVKLRHRRSIEGGDCLSASIILFVTSQGENNAGYPHGYSCTFPAMVGTVTCYSHHHLLNPPSQHSPTPPITLSYPNPSHADHLQIADWRSKFDLPNLSFFFVQLAVTRRCSFVPACPLSEHAVIVPFIGGICPFIPSPHRTI